MAALNEDFVLKLETTRGDEKRIDWSTGNLLLVLGGAVGFALKRSP
jgi:hypothetical protein